MRVLWLCNIMLPRIANYLELPYSSKEGWLTGLSDMIIENQKKNGVTLGICFPMDRELSALQGTVDGVSYFSFYENKVKPEKSSKELIDRMKEIVSKFCPDVIHVFGTEFDHTYALVQAIDDPSKVLISIQGICSIYANEYMADLPKQVQKRFLLRDLLKWDNIALQQKKFVKRGERETEVIQKISHVTGRTDFDREYALSTNPKLKYHFMNETLRSNFYTARWDEKKCEPYRILVSQGDYPIKGIHLLIKALPIIKEKYPTVSVYVAGNIITRYTTGKEKLKIGSYGKYLIDLIKELKVEETIHFIGMQSATQMCEQMKEAQVLVSPSSIENSPNSVGEAMLMGLPVISSNVGGVSTMLKNQIEGILYDKYNTRELANAILKVFEDKEFTLAISQNAREKAQITHNPILNYERLIEIYQEIDAMKQ